MFEQVSAALSVRLALAQVLANKIDFLIADEVSMGAMDDGILSSVPSMIELAATHRQIIVISHGGLFDSVASNVINVEYTGGESVIS